MRAIEGQTTLLGRTMHAIEYDATHDEIIVPQQFGQAVLVFAGGSEGETRPLRYIQGPRTQLVEPDTLAVDPVHNEIFVPEGDAILVYARDARGDTPPLRVLRSPGWPFSTATVAVDPVHDLLFVTNNRQRDSGVGAILVFNRTDSGGVKPRAVISGPRTGLTSMRNIRVYPPKEWLAVAEVGATRSVGPSDDSFVGVWSIHDNGDVPPRWRIGGPHGQLRQPRGIALDPERKTILVSDKVLNAVLTYSYPELY